MDGRGGGFKRDWYKIGGGGGELNVGGGGGCEGVANGGANRVAELL